MNPENLKRLRVSLGMTIGKCADDMNVSRQTLYNLESGKPVKPSTLTYYELYLKNVKRDRDYQSVIKDRTRNKVRVAI